MSKSSKPKFYVVWQGQRPGIYTSWPECEAQIRGFPGAQYKSFASRQQAEEAFGGQYEEFVSVSTKNRMGPADYERLGVELDSLSVDAACSGNPGVLEYQGVDTRTGETLFREGPFPEGTVNLGEFLAIVDGLRRLQREGRTCPIYSDSRTALSWLRSRRVQTNLRRSPKNAALFRRIDDALEWLAANTYPNEVWKWETESWGEIPADFGRK